MAERWCVQPGDVVVNKLAPLRAAVVSPASRRHPVDGNSIIVRGLPRPTAVWLAVCLNRPEYEQLLLIGSGVLRRIGLSTLATLQIPPVPAKMEALSFALIDLLDELLLVGEALHRAKAESERETRLHSSGPDLHSGVFINRAAMSSASWLPGSVALGSEQAELSSSQGWAPLRLLATFVNRDRLQLAPAGARALRLSDVGEDLFVPTLQANADVSALLSGRTLSKPLIGGEVLLSTLGTSSRAAYVDESVPANTFPTDNWVRLRFRETPAAWALLLSAPTIRCQIGRLAVGTIQQFVPPEALQSVHVPVPERESRDRWQRAVERHHAQRREFDRRWDTLWSALMQAFDDTHSFFDVRSGKGDETVGCQHDSEAGRGNAKHAQESGVHPRGTLRSDSHLREHMERRSAQAIPALRSWDRVRRRRRHIPSRTTGRRGRAS